MNYDAIFQSITDTWLPAFGFCGVIIVLILIYSIVKRKQK